MENDFTRSTLLGDHNVYFFASPKEKHEVLFSNLKAGLDMNCSALYIAGGETIEEVQVEMRNFGLKLDPVKLKIITSHKFYTPDGEFNANRVVEQLRSLIHEEVNRGFEGLFVSADAAEAFDLLSRDLKPWLKYENSLGRTFKFPMEAICAYRTDQMESKSQALLQLIQAHRNTITAKTAKFIDNRKLYIDAFTQEFNNLFGEKTTEIILHYLGTTFKLTQEQIPDKIEESNMALKSIFGNVATLIKLQILKNLHRKIEL